MLHVGRMAVKGDAQSVLDAIDVFCYSRHWFELDWNVMLELLALVSLILRCNPG